MDNEKKYAAWLRRQGRSKSTILSYSNSLRLYFEAGYRWIFEDACLWKENEMQRVKPATVNIRIHAINTYAQYTRVRWRLKPVKVQSQQFVEHQLTMSQYEKLLNCLLEDGQIRWWAAIKVLACTGVRISEFLQIKREDLKTGYVDVCGKGSKYRRIWFSSSLRQEVLSTFKEDGLLLPYSDGVIRKRLHAFARKYKLPKEPLHPHEFRAFYARQVYDRCKDLKFLQDLLGHSDIKTTVRYLRKTSKGISRRISKIVTWGDITGSASFRTIEPNRDLMASTSIERVTTGAFSNNVENWAGSHLSLSSFWKNDPAALHILNLDTGRVIRTSTENISISSHVLFLFRIAGDIRGEHRFCIGHYANEYKNSGVFGFTSAISRSPDIPNNVRASYEYMTIKFSNNFVAPCSGEEKPLTQSFFVLQRIAGDIIGELRGLIGNGTQSTGVFIRYAYEDWSVTSGTSGYKIDGSFKSSRVIPAVKDQPENIPILQALSLMIRVTGSSVKCALKKERFH